MSKNNFSKSLFADLGTETPSLNEVYSKKVNDLGLSQRQVESILNIERKSLRAILDKDAKRVDILNLLKLGTFIGLDFEESIKIFAKNLPAEQIKDIEKSRRLTFIVENFDLKTLKSVKFLESINDFEHIERRIKQFFGLDSIYDYEQEIGTAFSRTKKSVNNKMLDFWVKSAYAYLERVENPNEYNREHLKILIPQMKPFSRNVKTGLKKVIKALFSIGVTVIFQPYLPYTQVRGATFVVNNKPCIVITNFNKNYATLWFALLHELYHVLIELDKVKNHTFHLTGEPDLFSLMDEDKADSFARQYFLSNEKSKYIFPFIHDKLIVDMYAEKNNIHPSLIYNFYCYENSNYWGAFSRYLPDTKVALEGINMAIWQNDTIEDTINLAEKLIK